MTVSLGYRAIDADNHYYEPHDCFTRHLEDRYRDRAVNVRVDERGLGRVFVGDRPLQFIKYVFTDVQAPPGANKDLLQRKKRGPKPMIELIRPSEYPEFMERGARLKLMDQQGLEAIVQLPSLGVVVEHELRHDVEALYANFRAFNRWLEEEWGFGADGRIFGVPILSLVDPDLALEELTRVLGLGARFIHLRPGPVYGRSPADPVFDPFWTTVAEAGAVAIFHIGNSGYDELYSTLWGEAAHPMVWNQSAFQFLTGTVTRPIFDTLAALVLHNLFGRIPHLRVASIENGSDWVALLLEKMDWAVASVHDQAVWLGGKLVDLPSDIFRQSVWVNPFHEDDIPGLVGTLGAGRVLFGSDYPHPEGLPEPLEFVDFLAGVPSEDVRLVMRSNAAVMTGLAP